MRRLFFIGLILVMSLFTFHSLADVKILESFENTGDPADWRCSSPEPQEWNVDVHQGPAAPIFATTHVTDGARSGNFTFTWTKPGLENTTHYYGTVHLYWADRISVNAPANLGESGLVLVNSVLKADVYNDSNDAVGMAFSVHDGLGYERNAWTPLTPKGTTTVTWDLGTEPCYGWLNGDGSFGSATNVTFRGLYIYTESEPGDATFSIFVDNIRMEAQTDTDPPDAPVILSTTQGSAPGKLLITWAPNSEPDMLQYKIYQGDNHDFGATLTNRLALGTVKATVAHPTTSFEIDVPTTGPVYIHMKAVDNATPIHNESYNSIAFGASLRPDGAQPDDLVVLDLDRNPPGSSQYIDEGYYHDIVYYAQGLEDLGRYFESASAAGVADGTMPLIPNSSGIVAWANLKDGEAVTGQSISDTNVGKLTTFVNDGGNLMISGTALGEDLQTNGSTAGQAFYSGILKASLASDNVAVNEITGGGAPFPSVGTFQTGDNIYSYGAGATLDNEALMPTGGSSVSMSYTGVGSGYASVYYGYKVVYFGFAWETVRDNANATFAKAREKRAAILDATIDYLLTTIASADAKWALYE
jgi:hypothetical protein